MPSPLDDEPLNNNNRIGATPGAENAGEPESLVAAHMRRQGAAHSRPVRDLVAEFKTNVTSGLSPDEASARLSERGANELREAPRPTFWHMLLEQFKDFVVLILIVAAGISIVVGEAVDAIAITAIVIINAVIGVVQESKAENALRALKKMAAPNARVVRDGVPQTIAAREIVPGDLVILEAGNYVPADMRLVEAVNLRIDEASLTGESTPSGKEAEIVLARDAPVGDRKNLAFMSTLVSYGRGKGLVISTGMDTEIGLIAKMIQSYDEEETPLQKRLAELGKTLSAIALSVCALVFLIGIARYATNPDYHTSVLELFMTAVSLAIAAVPEGLPAVVTITLALGMQRMVRRHVLLRKLRAVETLGSTTVICSDKTGTLTQNQMTVTQIYAAGQLIHVTGKGYDPVGAFRMDATDVDPVSNQPLSLLLLSAVLCNDAQLIHSEEGAWRMIGDPTEGALVVMAAKAGLSCDRLEKAYPRVNEIPFDSDRKRMTTINEAPAGSGFRFSGSAAQELTPDTRHPIPTTPRYAAFVKGAPDIVLELCTSIHDANGVRPMTADDRQRALDANEDMATGALRVLGMAYRPLDQIGELDHIEEDLVFLGLAGMIDAARPEVKVAVRLCRQAGMKAVMITGDYKSTATAIAKELDFFTPGRETVTGAELDTLSDEAFAKIVNEVDVYARVSPQHKVRIVDALRSQNHIVAMTGDGVNDAPALKRADIGVAMGITGTDVSKETADMVLTDDNFASIVAAVEEGRIIYSNIRKFVFFLLACNVAEILIIFVAQLLGLPLPLRPIQLLWLNLLTDGLPALALALEKGDPDVMQHPPRPASEPVINRRMWIGIGIQAIVGAVAVLAAFIYGLKQFAGLPGDGTLIAAQTMAFIVLNCAELIVVFSFRSERFLVWSIGLFTNRAVVGATLLSFALLLVVVYIPVLQPIFYTTNLALNEWLVMIPLMFLPFVAAEITKLYWRQHEQKAVA
jgi:Ca2+-transporting ATPase